MGVGDLILACLACIAIAVLTELLVKLSFSGWPSSEKFISCVKDVAVHMRENVTEFWYVVQELGLERLLMYQLDIHQGNRRTSSSQPYGLCRKSTSPRVVDLMMSLSGYCGIITTQG